LLPERVAGKDACLLSRRLLVDPTLVQMVIALDGWADRQIARTGFRWPGIYIISGHRTAARQADVNPDAPNSLHRRCPSLAVDLSVGSIIGAPIPLDRVWELLGGMWKLMGGRWGGDFRGADQDITGINRREQNHFDLGVGVN